MTKKILPEKIDWEWADTPNYNQAIDLCREGIKRELCDVEMWAETLKGAFGEKYRNKVFVYDKTNGINLEDKFFGKLAQALVDKIKEGL